MNQRLTGRSTVLILASSVLVIDQTSKLWMTSSLSGGRTINAVPGLLDLHLVHNSGAAFSLLTGSTLLLSLLSLVVAVVVLVPAPPSLPQQHAGKKRHACE